MTDLQPTNKGATRLAAMQHDAKLQADVFGYVLLSFCLWVSALCFVDLYEQDKLEGRQILPGINRQV